MECGELDATGRAHQSLTLWRCRLHDFNIVLELNNDHANSQ